MTVSYAQMLRSDKRGRRGTSAGTSARQLPCAARTWPRCSSSRWRWRGWDSCQSWCPRRRTASRPCRRRPSRGLPSLLPSHRCCLRGRATRTTVIATHVDRISAKPAWQSDGGQRSTPTTTRTGQGRTRGVRRGRGTAPGAGGGRRPNLRTRDGSCRAPGPPRPLPQCSQCIAHRRHGWQRGGTTRRAASAPVNMMCTCPTVAALAAIAAAAAKRLRIRGRLDKGARRVVRAFAGPQQPIRHRLAASPRSFAHQPPSSSDVSLTSSKWDSRARYERLVPAPALSAARPSPSSARATSPSQVRQLGGVAAHSGTRSPATWPPPPPSRPVARSTLHREEVLVHR